MFGVRSILKSSSGPALGNQFTHGRDKLDGYGHRGVGRRLIGGLVLGDRLLVSLALVVF
jgi:hypothetical protein